MGIKERKDREKDLRRKQIQNAAKQVFIEKGFSSATMEDIAEKAELSTATIYLYFKNKGELYASLNLITLEYFFNKIEKVYKNSELSVNEKVFKFKDAMYRTYKYDPLIFRNIMHMQIEDSLLCISPDLLGKINVIAQKIMSMIADTYEEGVGYGKFVEGHKMVFADTMWALFNGLVLWEESKKKLNPKKNFLKSTLDMAINTLYRGIQKNDPQLLGEKLRSERK